MPVGPTRNWLVAVTSRICGSFERRRRSSDVHLRELSSSGRRAFADFIGTIGFLEGTISDAEFAAFVVQQLPPRHRLRVVAGWHGVLTFGHRGHSSSPGYRRFPFLLRGGWGRLVIDWAFSVLAQERSVQNQCHSLSALEPDALGGLPKLFSSCWRLSCGSHGVLRSEGLIASRSPFRLFSVERLFGVGQ